jgi:hypothetical protein
MQLQAKGQVPSECFFNTDEDPPGTHLYDRLRSSCLKRNGGICEICVTRAVGWSYRQEWAGSPLCASAAHN